MNMELARSMILFGKIFLGAAVALAVGAYVAAMNNRPQATALAKSLLFNCLGVGLALWALAWLIS